MKRKLFLQGLFALPFALRKEWLHGEVYQPQPKKKKRANAETQIYFNWGTMGLMPKRVINAMKADLDFVEDQRQYGHTKHLVEQELASIINAKESEVVILKNATEGACVASTSIPLVKNDEILITTHEHVGGCANWINMAQQKEAHVKTFNIGTNPVTTLDNFKRAITARTKVVAFPHIPCTTGLVLPVHAMAAYAKSKNIKVCIDGAHVLGMLSLDVSTINCDFYYGCLHKWMKAPLGTGWLYAPKESLKKHKSTMVGAYGVDSYDLSKTPTLSMDEENARKFAYGTYSTTLRAGTLEAFALFKEKGAQRIEDRVVILSRYLHEELGKLGSRVEMLIDPGNKEISGITGVILKKGGANVSHEFIKKNYSNFRLRFVSEAGLDCLRISVHYTNNKSQIAALVKAIKEF